MFRAPFFLLFEGAEEGSDYGGERGSPQAICNPRGYYSVSPVSRFWDPFTGATRGLSCLEAWFKAGKPRGMRRRLGSGARTINHKYFLESEGKVC